MTASSQVYAFVTGEVSKEFYGRRDLAKYPLALAECENFYIDYRGGVVNRMGTQHIGALWPQVHSFQTFKTVGYDLVLLFLHNKMYVLRDGQFVLRTTVSGVTLNVDGSVSGLTSADVAANSLIRLGGVVYNVVTATAGGITVNSPLGVPNPGTYQAELLYFASTGVPASTLPEASFYQDIDTIVVTANTQYPQFIKRVADNNWQVSTYTNTLPTPPTNTDATASASGAASTAFAITAVVDGVESLPGTVVILEGIVNYTVAEGFATVTWDAVSGAERYNVYRTLVFPGDYPDGSQFGYIGYSTGTTFVDRNTTPDFIKNTPSLAGYFDGGNYPAVYCRFQQRGVYAGLLRDPLTVVGSLARDKKRFSVSFPPIPTDSYKYTLDAQTERPIKHMLPLRYGLMLFTDDGVTQLRGGGDGVALTATSAIAEPQGFVAVSDIKPIAINLDVLFLTALSTELNAMVYTEYVNSFKMNDVLILASHLFGPNNSAVRMEWAAEPHKIINLIRKDGQRATLTYERNQEIFGWARHRTKGEYKDLTTLRESNYNLSYYTVHRRVMGVECLMLEREIPRDATSYHKMWFVDNGAKSPLTPGPASILLTKDSREDPYSTWTLTSQNLSWAVAGNRLYVPGGLFIIDTVEANSLVLRAMHTPATDYFYDQEQIRLTADEWFYAPTVTTVTGLWHLEGEDVSILADGDAVPPQTVVNGEITLQSSYGCILVGLPYKSRLSTLPLGLEGYNLDGKKLTIRGLALRQVATRGLAIGRTGDALEELPSRTDEAWGNPLNMFNELTIGSLWGFGGWDDEASIRIEQHYPLPATVVGLTYDLDVGE